MPKCLIKGGEKMNKALMWIAWILVVIGGLNWGLVGFFNFDLVAMLFGTMSTVSRIIYDLVGIAAIVMIFKDLKMK